MREAILHLPFSVGFSCEFMTRIFGCFDLKQSEGIVKSFVYGWNNIRFHVLHSSRRYFLKHMLYVNLVLSFQSLAHNELKIAAGCSPIGWPTFCQSPSRSAAMTSFWRGDFPCHNVEQNQVTTSNNECRTLLVLLIFPYKVNMNMLFLM